MIFGREIWAKAEGTGTIPTNATGMCAARPRDL
jgi:hypothetical protein